jgi:hypothetical protein
LDEPLTISAVWLDFYGTFIGVNNIGNISKDGLLTIKLPDADKWLTDLPADSGVEDKGIKGVSLFIQVSGGYELRLRVSVGDPQSYRSISEIFYFNKGFTANGKTIHEGWNYLYDDGIISDLSEANPTWTLSK